MAEGNPFLEKRQFDKVVHLLATAISIQSNNRLSSRRSRRNKQLTEIITFEQTLTGVTSVDFLTVVHFHVLFISACYYTAITTVCRVETIVDFADNPPSLGDEFSINEFNRSAEL